MASVAVAGSIAQRPGRGGHAWVFLNYLVGLQGLGHDVLFVDWLSPELLGSPGMTLAEVRRSPQARWLERVMGLAGLGDRYRLLVGERGELDGEGRRELLDRLRGVDLLINVNGYLRDEELRAAPGVAAFVDIDPAIQQMWEALELAELFAGHDLHFSVGTNLGRPGCSAPTCDIGWLPTRPPVAMDQWPCRTEAGGRFTSVSSWRGPYGPIEYGGETYGLRVHEFRRLASLASAVAADFAVALDIDAADAADADALREAGWQLLDPFQVAADPAAYRSFIQGSGAEISIAKEVYVRSRCGWFSDRSACYLASGRPVLAQDTGYSDSLPTGAGLLAFRDVEEAAAGAEEICGDWKAHSRAARRLAREHFDSRIVLREMLDAAAL